MGTVWLDMIMHANIIQWEIFVSINFRESLTNTPGINFGIFFVHNKITMSDHTPYNFPHENGDPQHVFQRRSRCYHAYQSVSVAVVKNCHAKGRKLTR